MQSGSKHNDKIRVGFILNLSTEWLGGVNYFRNLLNLINDNRDLNIEPVLFLSSKMNPKLLQGYPNVEKIWTNGMDRYTIPWLCSRVSAKLLHRELYWEYIVRKYHIDVLSHCSCWVDNAKKIAWIPDFQHKHLVDLFTADDLKKRDSFFGEIAEKADVVLLSSEDAKQDFVKYYHRFADKAQVYQFVVPADIVQYDAKDVRDKYGINGKFYFIPNQFWKHKNHRLVLEALHYLQQNGNNDIKVVCSGNTSDYRNHKYFNELMSIVDNYNLSRQFIVLGKIPYRDVNALMQECHALINPSLFEGWSTMVEEAKSMGKAIILSDINVHKEQNPAGGIFFKRKDYRDLADKMKEMWGIEEECMFKLQTQALDSLRDRSRKAICSYRRILEISLENDI